MVTNNTVDIDKPHNYIEGNILKLIYVGSPSYDDKSDSYVIFCYFQPWSISQNSSSGLPIVTHALDIDLAGILICGSLWTDSGELSRVDCKSSSDSQVFWSGTNKMHAVLLKDIISSETHMPETFWLTMGDTWVVCIEFNTKTIIIPYFELLRVLFYNSSHRLTEFFFSFLSLDLLCRSITVPTKDNLWHGAFYVSSAGLKAPEARVLGGLLFDQGLRNIFDLSQTHWLLSYSKKEQANKSLVSRKLAGNFNTSILFNASGYNFTHNNKKYFWVNSLEFINSPYKFRELIFHPLQRYSIIQSDSNSLFLCSELLKEKVNHSKYLYSYSKHASHDLQHVKPLSKSKKTIKRKKLSALPFPYITCGLSWGFIPKKSENFYWLDDNLAEQVIRIDKTLSGSNVASTKDFRKMLNKLRLQKCSIKYLSLNNPNKFFGENTSVFPVNGLPPLPIALYKNEIRICTIASIKLPYGTIFLIQPYPDENPELVVLCQKQDLTTPNDLEWNSIFDIINPIHNYEEFKKFSKKINAFNKTLVSTNTGLIAAALPLKKVTYKLCNSFSKHILSKFLRRLEFYIATSLKYPNGITYEQQKEVIFLSRSRCKAPSSHWVNTISNYWLELR